MTAGLFMFRRSGFGVKIPVLSEKKTPQAFSFVCDTSHSDSGSDLVSLPGLMTYVAPQVQMNE